ncbi:MAG: hypothetical protein P8J33_15980, partial [Pirellulaceae bacterium]|nr:hypothetical protein [Pirellulaceae bacterium]
MSQPSTYLRFCLISCWAGFALMMLVLSGPISHSIESCDVVSTAFLTSAEEGDLVGQTDSLHISHGPGDSLTEQVA